MSIEHIYVENEIKSFVYRIFGLFDKHVAVEEILQYLVDDPLEMDFPGAPIRSAQEFRNWYANVAQNCQWNVHNIEKIDVTLGGHGRYEVAVSLRWQALSRGKDQVDVFRVQQEWGLVEGNSGPKIARYIVKEFTPLPTPRFFAGLGPGAAAANPEPPDPRSPACHGLYDLNDAVARNDLIAAERLLKQGWDANRRDAVGFTPLMVAAGLGYVQMCERLLTAGADPTMVDRTMGATALHKAAQSGVVDIARLLVSRGAFIDAQAPTLGNTPLIDAVWHKRPAMVAYLLQQGARWEIENRGGSTAESFTEALNARPAEAAQIKALLEDRRKRDEAAADSQRLMAAIAERKKGTPIDIGEIRRLIESGAPIDDKAPLSIKYEQAPSSIKNEQWRRIAGYTPLLAACLGDTTGEVVRALLKAGANPRLVDDMIRATPGHKAGYQGQAAAAKALVEDGRFEIDAQGPYNGYTALHDAIWHGHIEAARVYIDAGARLDLRTHTGHTPLELAIDYDYRQIADLIREKLATATGMDNTIMQS